LAYDIGRLAITQVFASLNLLLVICLFILFIGSSGKCVPLGEERPKAFLMKVMKNSNSKMQTDEAKCKNVGVSMMPKG